ncbi:3'-5' exonuclease-like [Euwallacea similis]|uniref:3'-5' exonuclease-like n=1 Tax=Euwallacea similis TaxID=1736056 RepID=UPI00344FA983
MRLRSQVPQAERDAEINRKKAEKEEKLNRPLLGYNGKIVYANNLIECAMACHDLLNMAIACTEETFVVGFDMEWPFSFKTGSGKTSLIQISPNLEVCYLLHLPELKKLPKGLFEFLHHPKIQLAGINIKNDVRKLSRDYKGFNTDKLVDSCVDIGVLANNILPCKQRWSMESLVDRVLCMKINKDNKVRMSKWQVVPLDENQMTYAAIDGYASLRLYLELKALDVTLKKKIDISI